MTTTPTPHPLAGQTVLVGLPVIVVVRDDGGLDISVDLSELAVAAAEEGAADEVVDLLEAHLQAGAAADVTIPGGHR